LSPSHALYIGVQSSDRSVLTGNETHRALFRCAPIKVAEPGFLYKGPVMQILEGSIKPEDEIQPGYFVPVFEFLRHVRRPIVQESQKRLHPIIVNVITQLMMQKPECLKCLSRPVRLFLVVSTKNVSRGAPHEISDNIDRFFRGLRHDKRLRNCLPLDNLPNVLHLKQIALTIQNQREVNFLPAEPPERNTRVGVVFQSFVIIIQGSQNHSITPFPANGGISMTPFTMRA